MKVFGAILAAAALVASCSADKLLPDGWAPLGATKADKLISFRVAMPYKNLDVLDKKFWAVSTPGSPEYGQFMSTEELNELTASDPVHARAALDYFGKKRIFCNVEKTGSSLTCTGAASAINSVFGAELTIFKHKASSRVVHRIHPTDHKRVTFPSELEDHVSFVSGIVGFPVPHYGQKVTGVQAYNQARNGDYTGDVVIPETIANNYKTAGIKGNSGATQAAAEFQGLPAWSSSDLSTFISKTGIQSFDVTKKVGGFNPLEPQAESSLDVQYLGAVGEGNTNWYWTEAQWMYDFTENVMGMSRDDLPDIFSMSYGWAESQQCVVAPFSSPCSSGGSQAYVDAVNVGFQKIGATGVTLLAAAGDSGAFGRADPACISGHTNPAFPASSPYLTAVGATQLSTSTSGGSEPICSGLPDGRKCSEGGDEVVCSTGTGALITTGGGFSSYAARPAYQDEVVSAYLKKPGYTPTVAGAFNASGRGFPDVAALGHSYYVELDGQIALVDGTSCACPVFAGVIGLMNAQRVSAGKSKIGFANPLLYKIAADNAAAFTDITVGDNWCTESVCDCPFGFNATTGWDANSGLGVPNVAELTKADASFMGF